MQRVTMDDILRSSLGEEGSKIKATFKKTVLVKSYETEVVELETELTVEKELSGMERSILSAILYAQLEYTAYCSLLNKKFVTQEQFNTRKIEVENGINLLKAKLESISGKTLEQYFK